MSMMQRPSSHNFSQSPVARPARVYASQQQQHIDGLELTWSHMHSVLTVVVAAPVDDVVVDWL